MTKQISPITSLKTEDPEKQERPKFRYKGLATVCIVFFLWRVNTTREILFSALITVICFVIGIPIIMIMRGAGMVLENFGEWLVNRTTKK